ncbi:hypothetical protein SISNIDRAFT_484975 [Sistotremastrum niveocremeum HHB9708]|uniref:Uncharacterized protein n=1 Tax=Sistotremastrum niveocremeum HHB9708 TaxID=1314777 RepID=A0A164VC92_9AGAM|nr:hypothetical protein SISNIDRAFT_484975 [Sistotremastrum niveocremeum HHB9708]
MLDLEGNLVSKFPYLKSGRGFRVTRLYRKVVDEPEWGYATVYRMDVVHTASFSSTDPFITFASCLQHPVDHDSRFLSVILPFAEGDYEIYDHYVLPQLRPYVQHLLHRRRSAQNAVPRLDCGIRESLGSYSWHDARINEDVPYLMETEIRMGQPVFRRI